MPTIHRHLPASVSAELARAVRAAAYAHSADPRKAWRTAARIMGCGRTTAFRVLRGDVQRLRIGFAINAAPYVHVPNLRPPQRPRDFVPQLPTWDDRDDAATACAKSARLLSDIQSWAIREYGLIVQAALRCHLVSGFPMELSLTLTRPCSPAVAVLAVTEMNGRGAIMHYCEPAATHMTAQGELTRARLGHALRHAARLLEKGAAAKLKQLRARQTMNKA